jgi:hypothetical protein
MMQRMRVFAQIAADGTLLSLHRGHVKQMPGWLEVRLPLCQTRIVNQPERWLLEVRYDSDGVPYAHTLPRTRVFLSVDQMEFLADGVDAAVVMVAGLPEDCEAVNIEINGQSVLLPRIEDGQPGRLEIASPDPGLWQVRLRDARFWSDPAAITVRGFPATEENRQRIRPTVAERGW